MKGMIGVLHYRYEIAPHQVTLHRPLRIPIVLLVLGMVGGIVACVLSASVSRRHQVDLILVGVMLLSIGGGAAFMTPWIAPPYIVVTPLGIRWGTRHLDRTAIVSVSTQRRRFRGTRGSTVEHNTLRVDLSDKTFLQISLGDANLRDLEVLQTGFRAVLG